MGKSYHQRSASQKPVYKFRRDPIKQQRLTGPIKIESAVLPFTPRLYGFCRRIMLPLTNEPNKKRRSVCIALLFSPNLYEE